MLLDQRAGEVGVVRRGRIRNPLATGDVAARRQPNGRIRVAEGRERGLLGGGDEGEDEEEEEEGEEIEPGFGVAAKGELNGVMRLHGRVCTLQGGKNGGDEIEIEIGERRDRPERYRESDGSGFDKLLGD